MSLVDLRNYDNAWYHPGGSLLKRIVWMMVGQPCLASKWLPGSGFRVRILRAFGARVGSGVVIKPSVRVKYPWHLELGEACWIGEDCWIDNLTTVRIGANACICVQAITIGPIPALVYELSRFNSGRVPGQEPNRFSRQERCWVHMP